MTIDDVNKFNPVEYFCFYEGWLDIDRVTDHGINNLKKLDTKKYNITCVDVCHLTSLTIDITKHILLGINLFN